MIGVYIFIVKLTIIRYLKGQWLGSTFLLLYLQLLDLFSSRSIYWAKVTYAEQRKKEKKWCHYSFTRAEILRKENNPNDAIMNYSMAIKLNPRDHEAYFQRAAMYEKVSK